jgi:heme/copper-type cytochrome/quinol oxidase subunit 2
MRRILLIMLIMLMILFLFVLIYFNATICVRKYPVEVYKSGYEARHLVRSLFSEVV